VPSRAAKMDLGLKVIGALLIVGLEAAPDPAVRSAKEGHRVAL
jgi:hypothetical protein